MIERLPLSDLIEDLSIFPRGTVSDIRVADLVYSIDAGETLPPPVIDKATRKIVDGFHRVRAWRRRLGDDGVIDVDVQEFADDLAMLSASASINRKQGLPLGRYDQRVVHIRAKQLGATDDDVAAILGLTPVRVLQIAVREAKSDDGDVPLKRGVEHLGGNYLSAEQVAEIQRMRGAPIRAKVAELTRLLQHGLTPVQQDPDLRLALAELAVVIGAVLEPFNVSV